MKKIYADTSIFGGVFDNEFSSYSLKIIDAFKKREFKLITSEIVREEIRTAPKKVRDLFDELSIIAEIVNVNDATINLMTAYIEARVVPPKFENDALHVALATVSNCSMIVSWNFKHIVNYKKIPLYNAINLINGYKPIDIYSPLEVII